MTVHNVADYPDMVCICTIFVNYVCYFKTMLFRPKVLYVLNTFSNLYIQAWALLGRHTVVGQHRQPAMLVQIMGWGISYEDKSKYQFSS